LVFDITCVLKSFQQDLQHGRVSLMPRSWSCVCPSGASWLRFHSTCLRRNSLALHLEQTVQLRTIAAGERHLLFASNNVGSHIGQACRNLFLLPHPLKRELGITFAQGR
jgi:hypothetical protein